MEDLARARITLNVFEQGDLGAIFDRNSDDAGPAAVREEVLHRPGGGLNGAWIAVAVDVGGHDTLAAQPPDVLAEHAAGLGEQLEVVRGHLVPSIRFYGAGPATGPGGGPRRRRSRRPRWRPARSGRRSSA